MTQNGAISRIKYSFKPNLPKTLNMDCCYVVDVIYRVDDYKNGGEDWETHEYTLFRDKEDAYAFAIETAVDKIDDWADEDDEDEEIKRFEGTEVEEFRELFQKEDETDADFFNSFIKSRFHPGEYIISPSFEVVVSQEEIL